MILPILIASISSMIVGFLWFSPFVFGRQWATLSGINPENMPDAKSKEMLRVYVLNFLMDLVTATVLLSIFKLLETSSIIGSLEIGLIMWLGFMMPIEAGQILWLKKPFNLFLINSLHRLLSVLVMGIILTLFI